MGKDKNIPIERNSKSISNGFGSITIPVDIDREDYLRDFYRTGYCILITNYNEVKKQVSVPKHLIDDIQFPLIPGGKGSLVHWARIPGSGQLVITGVHLRPEEFDNSTELQKVEHTKTEDGSISVVRNLEINGYQVSISGSQQNPGEILLSVSDGQVHSKFSLNGSGITILETGSLDVECNDISISIDENKRILFDEDDITIEFGSQSIVITEDRIILSSDKIISLESNGSSVSVTDNGVSVETDKKIYLEGSKPVLYSKIDSATEILDVSQIGVSKKVRVG